MRATGLRWLGFPLVLVVMTSVAGGRERGGAAGSAITPAFSLEHDVMRPGEAVSLLACVTNASADGRRAVERGDSVSLAAPVDMFVDCEMADVVESGDGFSIGDWTCATDGLVVTLTHVGDRSPWPQGEPVCARIRAMSPAASTTILTSAAPLNLGAWAPPENRVVFLSVDSALGSVGPQGPEGATGPSGPAGPSSSAGIGEVVQLRSERGLAAREDQPPQLVPGLDGVVAVRAGSRLLVQFDAALHKDCPLFSNYGDMEGIVSLEIDGTRVASHLGGDDVASFATGIESISFTWLTPPLPPGPHQLQAFYEYRNTAGGFRATLCIGGAPDSPMAARLTVIELTAP